MNVEIHLPPMFRHLTGAGEIVPVHGATIGEALAELVRRYPGLETTLFAEGGGIKPGISVFLNGENVYPDEPSRPVRDGDTIHIAQLVLGG